MAANVASARPKRHAVELDLVLPSARSLAVASSPPMPSSGAHSRSTDAPFRLTLLVSPVTRTGGRPAARLCSVWASVLTGDAACAMCVGAAWRSAPLRPRKPASWRKNAAGATENLRCVARQFGRHAIASHDHCAVYRQLSRGRDPPLASRTGGLARSLHLCVLRHPPRRARSCTGDKFPSAGRALPTLPRADQLFPFGD